MAALPPKTQPTRDAIFASHEREQDDGYRAHLGASLIGHSCSRALWFTLRWATRASHTGRLLRLFQTGHLAEQRFISELRAIGVRVMSVDPDSGEQWKFRDETGHFGGSLDAVGIGFLEAPKTWAGVEMKTHSEKSFKDLVAKGVQQSKPLHWAQMQAYAHMAGLTRFFYIAVNKNTDDIHTEWVHADPAEGIRLLAKARRVIDASRPPERIAASSDWFQCRFCDHHRVCWEGARPERHCRSCLHSTPVADGEWHCAHLGRILTHQEQRDGCPSHLFIPDFIQGEQVDAAEDWSWVEYRLPDGSLWRDGSDS